MRQEEEEKHPTAALPRSGEREVGLSDEEVVARIRAGELDLYEILLRRHNLLCCCCARAAARRAVVRQLLLVNVSYFGIHIWPRCVIVCRCTRGGVA